jgi:glutaredoxin
MNTKESTMLELELKNQLAGYLQRVQQPFDIVATLDDSETSKQMLDLLQTIQGLRADKITLRTDGNDARKPSFSLTRTGSDTSLRFAGLPLGHEFTSLVLALLWTGGHPPKVEQDDRHHQGAGRRLRFEMYMSLTCHNCPDVVQALSLMAILNPRVKTVVIEGGAFQKEVEERQVMAVPMVFLNGEMFGSGRMMIEEIVAKLDKGAGERDAAKLNAKEPYDVLIVGGGPAGSAAAVYAARKGIRTGIATGRMGGQVNDTMSIENYISVLETDGPKFSAALEAQVRHYGVDIMTQQEAAQLIAPSSAGRTGRGALRQRRFAEVEHRDPVDRRALEERQRAGRAAVQERRRELLPALRRPAVQGQARGRDRRRQLGRGSGDRPGRHRPARDPDRIREPAESGRGAGQQAEQPAERDRPRERPDHRDHRRRQEGQRHQLQGPRVAAKTAMSNWKACSCRSAWCRTPNG